MKVSFSREVKYVPQWNGNQKLPETDQFHVTLRPLEMGDLFLVVDALGGARAALGTGDEINLEKISDVDSIKNLVKEVGHLLPKYVTVSHLEDDSGPIGVEDILKYPIYMNLMGELIAELSNISMPNEDEVGN